MASFRTQYDRVQQVSNSGERLAPTYSSKVSKDGVIDLVETGKVDLYEQIQSWRESCDIKVILQKYVNGDISALDQRPMFFGDFSDAPVSLSDYYQRLIDAEEAFNRLPVETRAKFNHSSSEFFTSMGSEKFNEIMGINTESSINSDTSVVDDKIPIVDDKLPDE